MSDEADDDESPNTGALIDSEENIKEKRKREQKMRAQDIACETADAATVSVSTHGCVGLHSGGSTIHRV